MDAGGLGLEVGVKGAEDDAGVVGGGFMEAEEMFAIESEEGAVLTNGEGQDFMIGPGLIGLAGFEDG